jgi:(1->4)-alpha-D-glucan 1-alpha-D-glucosylmutase
MLKAAREAKVHTSWLTPNQAYEDALARFVRHALSGAGGSRLLAALLPFQRRLARLGMINSLAQVALKTGSPGVPDFYQGTELWDLSLVDPDNRRPVDFERRARLLDEVDTLLSQDAPVRAARIAEWLESWRDGRVKLLVTAAGLRLRRALPHVFLGGGYVPLDAEITVPAGAVAFVRSAHAEATSSDAVLFVAPRLCASIVDDAHPVPLGGDCWKASRLMLPPGLRDCTFVDVISGAEIAPSRAGDTAWIFLGEIFQALPVGILRASFTASSDRA